MAKKIIVAEDSVVIQKSIAISLSQENYPLSFVGNGHDALSRVISERPDLLITDVSMPQMNGLELCQNIRSNPSVRNVPILVLAGSHEGLSEEMVQSKGGTALLIKPFESHVLVSKVKHLLEQTTSASKASSVQHEATFVEHEESSSGVFERTMVEEDSFDAHPNVMETPKPQNSPSFDFSDDDDVTLQAHEDDPEPSPFAIENRFFDQDNQDSIEISNKEDEMGEWMTPGSAMENWANPRPISLYEDEKKPSASSESSLNDMHKQIEKIDHAVLEQVVRKVAKEIIEKIAWEVVPDQAERIIKEEIERLTRK
ncbi:MAG: response regulator [Bdellovibrionota bacterium]